MSREANKHVLTRSNLRDVVLILSFASAIYFNITTLRVVAGFSLLIAGCFLHLVTKGILIRNVVLCDRGIYGVIRHPYYLANYIIDTGFCVLSGNIYLLLAYPFLFFWSYGPTMRKEEAFLSSNHADAFVEHSSDTPQIFPDRASLKGWRSFLEGFSVQRISWKEYARIARFCSLGLFIGIVHETKMEGLAGLLDLVRPRRHDYDEFLFALAAVILYAVSFLFLKQSGKRA